MSTRSLYTWCKDTQYTTSVIMQQQNTNKHKQTRFPPLTFKHICVFGKLIWSFDVKCSRTLYFNFSAWHHRVWLEVTPVLRALCVASPVKCIFLLQMAGTSTAVETASGLAQCVGWNLCVWDRRRVGAVTLRGKTSSPPPGFAVSAMFTFSVMKGNDFPLR